MSLPRSTEIAELAAALAAAQREIRSAEMDRENPHFRSRYATLASVWDACREPLASHGLSVSQAPSSTPAKRVQVVEARDGTSSEVTVSCERVALDTVLLHSSGQWLASRIELVARDSSPQAVGSAITYARRYALAALVGVAPDDDDGNDAQPQPGPKPRQAASGSNPSPGVRAMRREGPAMDARLALLERQLAAAQTAAEIDAVQTQVAALTEQGSKERGEWSRRLSEARRRIAPPAAAKPEVRT